MEDAINRLMESRKLLPNASYFAFTATPKNKTLEIFGEPLPEALVAAHDAERAPPRSSGRRGPEEQPE